MQNNFPNKLSEMTWGLIKLQAQNNIKTPLGYWSLFINLNPSNLLENTFAEGITKE